MGWTFSPERDHDSIAERVRADLEDGEVAVLVDSERVGRAVYSAVRHKPSDTVFAVVTLIEHRDGMIGLKHIDEAMGPFESRCPTRILDLLSPAQHERAQEWRETCRDLAEGVCQ